MPGHCRSYELQCIRTTVSKDSSILQLQDELNTLSREERQEILKSAGVTIDIPLDQGLTMKADLCYTLE